MKLSLLISFKLFICFASKAADISVPDIMISGGKHTLPFGEYKNLSVKVEEQGSRVDLTKVRINGLLRLTIKGENNVLIMNHANPLVLQMYGINCKVTNLCYATENSTIAVDIRSIYEDGTGLFYQLFGRPTFFKKLATTSVVGLIVWMLYSKRQASMHVDYPLNSRYTL